MVWSGLLAWAAMYCVARATGDLRHGRHGWAIAGAASAVILLLIPIQTHAVKIDLPAARPVR